MVKINDRRNQALGGQANNRKESGITHIAWHYTAVARKNRSFITSHERYWQDTLGWKRGGYHYYIDADGKVYQNYNLTTITNGVRSNNVYTVHISVEANGANDYSKAQIDARHELTLMLMQQLNIPASRVMQHKEYPGASTSCAGYTKAQMDAFRQQLTQGKPAQSAKWIKNNTGWWYRNADGTYPKDKWQKVNDTWYLFDKRGYMLTGWQKVKNTWYYLASSGAMQTGWIKLKNDWYYLNPNGAMATGWKRLGDEWYYLYPSGKMATGLIEVAGKHYYLQRNGVLITDSVVKMEANKHGHLR